ncbi:type II secretion system protein [Sulfurimonas sp.]|uniref:type II secretion system protein n=1 Tax=Sulfurimonas sp. TaxID=2022749 RepID=UPI003D101B81
MQKRAFTLIELIFVIVIMGILSKYGIELLFQAYRNFIFSKTNNALQSQSQIAVETIAARLMYRIKDSAIARQPGVTYEPVASSTLAENATVLEWVGYDVDGQRGDGTQTTPLWSGVIDLDLSNANMLKSPATDTTKLNALIGALSNGGSNISHAALYFIGSDSDIYTGYGWNGVLNNHNNSTIHRINSNANSDEFVSGIGGVNFGGTDIFEYYQAAWTAYAVVHDPNNGELRLFYDYQPWLGESYTDNGVKNQLIMNNVDTFRFTGVGSIIKIQVCVNTDLMEDYSLCKEKTVF